VVDWDWIALHAPIATACIALVAATIAAIAIGVQRSIARQRASIDFFVKTEMDKSMLDAHENYLKGVIKLREAAGNWTTMAAFEKTPDYQHVRTYLNIHELIAVAINRKVFDEDVCYHFWSDTLVRHCTEASAVFKLLRRSPEPHATYHDLKILFERWSERRAKWFKENPYVPVA
jgi:Domain of unknown function (DUF4760)